MEYILHTWVSGKRWKGIYEMITVIMSSGITGDFYFLLYAFYVLIVLVIFSIMSHF